MSLADFIEVNIEPILKEWEEFARKIWADDASVTVEELRDDAEGILRATVEDMRSAQSEGQRERKSHGEGKTAEEDSPMNRASVLHGGGRVGSGFDMAAVVAEYRALRASVIRRWRDSRPALQHRDLEDLTRFNESIDQSLTQAVNAFMAQLRERDATAAREQALRQAAEAANDAKDAFLGTLSHELRTPLNAIILWTNILRSKNRDEKDLIEGLEVIHRSGRAQAKLIEDVLDLSRIHSGKLSITREPCQLAKIIRDGVGAVRPAAEARDISLVLQLEPDMSAALCDAARMQQVVWNLVSNAVKFTPPGGRVEVTLRCVDKSTQIQVSDNGEGIDPQVLPYIFDRFQQGDGSLRRRHAGLGLGLSIVKYLVEAHGGTVEAFSAGKGQGSTFTVLLPNQAASADSAADAGETKVAGDGVAAPPDVAPEIPTAGERVGAIPPLAGMHVLLVDDEPDVCRVLAIILGRLGAIVTTATGAAEALEMIPGMYLNVLISDIGMPGMDGIDLIRELRQGDRRNLPSIALTAFAHHTDARRILAAGYDVHIAKPVDPDDLTATILRLIGEKRRN